MQAGFKVVVLERSATLRQTGAAIALQTNAFRALKLLGNGIAEDLRAVHPDLAVWEYYTQAGQLLRKLRVADCDHGPHEMRGVRTSQSAQRLLKQCSSSSLVLSLLLVLTCAQKGFTRCDDTALCRLCETSWLRRFPAHFPRALSA